MKKELVLSSFIFLLLTVLSYYTSQRLGLSHHYCLTLSGIITAILVGLHSIIKSPSTLAILNALIIILSVLLLLTSGVIRIVVIFVIFLMTIFYYETSSLYTHKKKKRIYLLSSFFVQGILFILIILFLKQN